MDIFGIGEIGSMVVIALAGIMVVVAGTMLSSWSRGRASRRAGAETGSRRARRAARRAGRGASILPEIGADQVPRIAALERSQAETVQRLAEIAAGQSAPEERLKAMAGQMLGLIRDKNATLETALAGLDQLRSRMNTLEQIGDAAEARGLLESLEAKLASGRAAEAEARAAMEARLRALETPGANPFGEIADQLTRLYAQKDAAVETVLDKLAPLEARIAGIEAAAPAGASALGRMEAELVALREGAAETTRMLAEMRAAAEASGALATRVEAVEADGTALARTLTDRLDAMARELQSRDPETALAGLEGRLDGLKAAAEAGTAALAGRIAALETPGESPFAEISEQLTRLYGQKDAVVETVFARLAPLEAKLGAVEDRLEGLDPAAALDRFAERFEGVQARLDALEAPGESPFAEISDQLTRLYAQKDATVESVFTRLAPMEARLAEVETALAAADPAALLDGFAGRMTALADRVAVLETPGESLFAEISDQLTRLYAQKDATVETVFARLAPLEERLRGMEAALAEADPAAEIAALRDAQDGQGARLETLAEARSAEARETGDRIAALERDLAARDPQAALDRVADRLDLLQERLVALETPGESPFAEISDQLTRLYAQKDATVETVFARLAPLEARLGEMEEALTSADPAAALAALEARIDGMKETQAAQGGAMSNLTGRLERLSEITSGAAEALRMRLDALDRDRAENDPAAMLERFAERLAAMQKRLKVLETPGESPFAEISDQLTRLYAQKDATVATVFARLAPLEERLAEVETELVTRDPAPALAGLTERLAGMEALPPRLEALETEAVRRDMLEAVSQRLDALGRETARAPVLDKVVARLDALDWAQDEVSDRLVALSTVGARAAETARDAAREAAREEARVAVAPFAGIAEQLGTLFSRKEAAVEAVLDRLAPVEARLAELEARPWDPEADEARAEIQAIASQMIAARTAADQTALFAERLAVLEASLPRLSAEQSMIMREMAGQGAARPSRPAGPRPRATFGEPEPGRVLPAALDGVVPGGMEEVWALPRLVSLHHKQ